MMDVSHVELPTGHLSLKTRFSLALQRGQVEGSEKGPVPRERALRCGSTDGRGRLIGDFNG